MTFGNNGAGPVGVPPVGPSPNAGQMIGTGGGTYPPLYNASFESVLAAVSRGEVSLNTVVGSGSQFGGNNANAQQGNPTLLQAISQGLGQNGTNGLNGGPGGGTVNSSYSSVQTAPGSFNDTNPGGTQSIDATQMMANDDASLSSPLQYGGN
jgi:hypothetical protein